MVDKEKSPQESESDSLVETPVFSRLREWWRARKESLDLWGLEKYLGVDNSQFKSALSSYKSLLEEIEHEYKESSHDKTEAEIEEARRRREQNLLDAKRDFVYNMPENYRIWFKKRRIFSSWRHTPESWGFEESRYWGSRSGLATGERRVVLASVFIGVAILGFYIYKASTTETIDVMEKLNEKAIFNVDRDTTGRTDSLVQVRIREEKRAADEKRRQRLVTERNNNIINQLNEGIYITNSTDMKSEVRYIMQLYSSQKGGSYNISNEALGTSLVLIGNKNRELITGKDKYGIPTTWQANSRVNISWADILAGVDVMKGRK